MSDIKTQRKNSIYEAVLRLVKDGKSYYSIKVSDIAKEAGIGKGTVYEYFDSRDTIISEAVVYYLGGYLEHAVELVESNDTFESRLRAVFEYIYSETDESMSVVDILFANGGISDIYSILKEPDMLNAALEAIDGYIEDLLNDAAEEGAIKPIEDMRYSSHVLKAAVSGFIFSVNPGNTKRDFETAYNNSMKLILKALN